MVYHIISYYIILYHVPVDPRRALTSGGRVRAVGVADDHGDHGEALSTMPVPVIKHRL